MSGNLSFFENRAGYRTRGSSIGADPTIDPVRSNPSIVQFRQKATQYIASLSKVGRRQSNSEIVFTRSKNMLLINLG